MTDVSPDSRPSAYPPRNIRFRSYVVDWWIYHFPTKRLGRVIKVVPRARGLGKGAYANKKYRVFFPASTPPNWLQWCEASELRSATQMQSQAMSLHPLASHIPDEHT